jgi:hypothetical protein
VASMCKKCLKSAAAEARRCASCGGRIVRFSETGEMIELDAVAEEPGLSHGVPALFANLENSYEFASPAPNVVSTNGVAPMQSAPHAQPQAGGASIATPPPPNAAAYTGPVPGPVNSQMNGMAASPERGHEGPGLAAPLPMGYAYTDGGAPPVAPARAEPSGTFLLPVTQLDDVVGEILAPFGFEVPAPHVSLQTAPVMAPVPEVLAAHRAPQTPPLVAAPPPPPPPPPPAPPPPPPISQAPRPSLEPSAAPLPALFSDQPIAVGNPAVPAPPVTTVGLPNLFADTHQPVAATHPAPVTPVLQTREESGVSMAEMARDIMSVSDQEPIPRVSALAVGIEEPGIPMVQSDSDRRASFDLLIGPATKGGRLKRSKGSMQKGPVDSSEEFDSFDELAHSPELDTAGAKGRSRGRLWTR